MEKWVCEPCGYVYDPAEGDPDNGVEPGTAFETYQKIGYVQFVVLHKICL